MELPLLPSMLLPWSVQTYKTALYAVRPFLLSILIGIRVRTFQFHPRTLLDGIKTPKLWHPMHKLYHWTMLLPKLGSSMDAIIYKKMSENPLMDFPCHVCFGSYSLTREKVPCLVTICFLKEEANHHTGISQSYTMTQITPHSTALRHCR